MVYASAMGVSLDRWRTLFSLAVPSSLALLSLVLALRAWPGIAAARQVIGQLEAKQDGLRVRIVGLDDHRLAAPADTSTGTRRREGVVFAKYAPRVFIPAWCFFGALPVLFSLRG